MAAEDQVEEDAPPEQDAFDRVHVGTAGEAMVALHGAVATASGAVLILGWALDPAEEADGLFLEMADQSYPV